MRVNGKTNIFGDGIAKVESFDFSRANMSEESRVLAVTTVASICYGNPKGIGKVSLYDRLYCESMGLPSSSFEFVPVLIPDYKKTQFMSRLQEINHISNCEKFGEVVEGNALLTNLRALLEDVGKYASEFFNTEEECEIIKKHFKVFRAKIDLPTRSQMVRHRMSFQELSRRYVSGDRQAFEFYISDGMRKVTSTDIHGSCESNYDVYLDTTDIIDQCIEHYYKAIKAGVKPQEARRIIPQAAYTDIWIACLPSQYDNFISQRTDDHAQYEIRQLALAMEELVK